MIDSISIREIQDLRTSVQRFGFALLPCSLGASLLARLKEEAEQQTGGAVLAEQSEDLKYRAKISSLGPRAREFLRSPSMMQLLTRVFGGAFALTEGRSCLTFYQEGHHLGPHLDRPAEECAVTAIVYIATSPPPFHGAETGLELRIYGEKMTEGSAPSLTIPTRAGGVVLGYGSRYWHERPTLRAAEHVAAITGCYSRATDGERTISRGIGESAE